jgi:hypothetical protein
MFPTRGVADSFFSAPFLTQEIPQKNRLQPCQVLMRESSESHGGTRYL